MHAFGDQLAFAHRNALARVVIHAHGALLILELIAHLVTEEFFVGVVTVSQRCSTARLPWRADGLLRGCSSIQYEHFRFHGAALSVLRVFAACDSRDPRQASEAWGDDS